MTGPDAAQLFCDTSRFMRRGAMAVRIQKTLLGRGGVQGLDDEEHRHRKRMFMSLMSPARIKDLADATEEQWRACARRWSSRSSVVLYDELHELLTRSVCGWAGVPLAEAEVSRRTREVTAMFDYAGAVGPRHWWARLARKRSEHWLAQVINRVRSGQLHPPEHTALHTISWHRDPRGALLEPRIAAVELLNVIRPTVAVAVYITFVAHALHEYPHFRERLSGGDGSLEEMFVQEVRRFYPLFPAVAARVRRSFTWKEYAFPQDRIVLLDLYGTNRDARAWDAPDEFRPERFAQWDNNPFSLVPQGPGDHLENHRCPGEWIAIELMKVSLRFLVRELCYDVPEQDLRVDYSRLPALPHSQFIMSNIKIHK